MRLEQLENSAMAKKGGGSKKAKKNKKVSDQVKKMLIKSRAEGNKKIRAEDRIYLDVVLFDVTKVKSAKDGDDSGNRNENGSEIDGCGGSAAEGILGDESKQVERFMSSSYMFFSRVATVGKLISTRTGSSANFRDIGAELLVLTSPSNECEGAEDSMVYRRLPPTLPLHEAESRGYFKNFGRVIVRVFKADVDAISNCYTESITK